MEAEELVDKIASECFGGDMSLLTDEQSVLIKDIYISDARKALRVVLENIDEVTEVEADSHAESLEVVLKPSFKKWMEGK
jgi:hypothetical protein